MITLITSIFTLILLFIIALLPYGLALLFSAYVYAISSGKLFKRFPIFARVLAVAAGLVLFVFISVAVYVIGIAEDTLTSIAVSGIVVFSAIISGVFMGFVDKRKGKRKERKRKKK